MAPVQPVIDLISELDADAVLTTGGGIDPTALSSIPANLRVENYVPQHLFLQRAALLISHAGSGATLGGAAFGVPQLCLPIAADQFENADALTGAGAGLTVEPEDVTLDTLRSAAHQLLFEPTFAQSARQLADEVANMPHPAEQVGLLVALASRRSPDS
jgi:UDP:flavonoid glycosyltransferase YjiC (YdhE family)